MTHRTAAACVLALASLALPSSALAAIQYVAGPGSGPAQFNKPTAISVNAAGELVVGDAGNARVQKLTRAGAHILSFNVPYGSGGYVSALYSAVGNGDDIYTSFVPPHDSGPVSRYTTSGSLVKSWGSAFDPQPLSAVEGVAVDGAGDVYVLAFDTSIPSDTYRVARHTADGTYVSSWQLRDATGLPRDPLAIAARGNVVAVVLEATESAPAELVRYDTGGNVLSRSDGGPSAAFPNGRLSSVQGLTIAPSGEIFTAGSSLVHRFSASGEYVDVYNDYGGYDPYTYSPTQPPNAMDVCSPRAPDPTYPSTFPNFSAVAIDEHGDLYLTDTARNAVMRMNGVPTAVFDWGPRRPDYNSSPWPLSPPTTGETITFDARRSALPFGTLTRFEWDFDADGTFEVDGGGSSVAKHVFVTAGWHEVRMRVTGSRGASAVATARILVSESQAWMFVPPIGVTGKQIKLNASNSGTTCGESTYEWDLDGDGSFETSTGATPYALKVFDEVGTRIVRVRITRGGGRVDVGQASHETRPAPPPGPVGVTINDGAQFTNNSVVHVNPVWPKFTQQMIVANDGGFRRSRTFPVRESQPWRLDSSGPERLPKTIYVRFEGTGLVKDNQTFTDDIILDETNPLLTQVDIVDYPAGGASVSKRRTVRLLVRARDNLSGVSRMQVTAKRKRPGKWRRMRRISRVRTGADALWVRVRDKAGNRSRWKLAR